MATIKLNKFEIKKLEDKNFNPYYLIINSDNRDDAYFCFESLIKEGWNILSTNPSSPINITYEENEQNGRVYKRVTHLYTDDDDIFV